MPPRELFEPPLDQIVLRNRPPDPLPAGLHLEIDPTGIDATPLYLDTFVQHPGGGWTFAPRLPVMEIAHDRAGPAPDQAGARP